MARIKIKDINKNHSITKEEMKQVTGGIARGTIAPISIVKKMDAASPALLTSVCTGETIDEVALNFYDPDSDNEDSD